MIFCRASRSGRTGESLGVLSLEEYLEAARALRDRGCLSPLARKAEKFLGSPAWDEERAGFPWETAWCVLAYLWGNAFPDLAVESCPGYLSLTPFHFCRWRGRKNHEDGLFPPPASVQEAAGIADGGFDCVRCRGLCLRRPELAVRTQDKAPLPRIAERMALSLLASLATYRGPGTAAAMWVWSSLPVADDGWRRPFRQTVNFFLEESRGPEAKLAFSARFAEALSSVAGLLDGGELLGLPEEYRSRLDAEGLARAANVLRKVASAVSMCCGAADYAAGGPAERAARGAGLLEEAFTAMFLCAAEALDLEEKRPYSSLADGRFAALFRPLFED